MTGDVDLQIPLSLSESRGAKYDINANFRNGELYIPELALHFEKLNAKLKYDLKRGLHGNNLQASLWGQSIEAKLESTAKSTALSFGSQLAIEPLAQWMNIPAC